MCKFIKVALICVLSGFASIAATAHAQTTSIGTTQFGSLGFSWGDRGIPSLGQTFVAPTGSVSLSDFSFTLGDRIGGTGNGNTPFKAYFYAWSDAAALPVGNPLFVSDVLTIPVFTSATYRVTVNTAAAPVTAGSKYIFFVSTSGLQTSTPTGQYVWITASDNYAPGASVTNGTANNPALLTTVPWGSGEDLLFQAKFNLTPAAAPEPGSLPLLGMGLVGGVGLVRRRSRFVSSKI